MKKKLKFIILILLMFMVIPITNVNAEPAATNVVSNLEELQNALNNDSFTEVIVNNAITLPNGTILDGKGKTVRVEKPYVKENGQLEESPSTTRVFTIENSSNITIKNMTIMGGQINGSAAISSKGNLTMENVNVVRSNRGLDNDGGITILKKCNFSLNVGQSAGAIWSGNGAKIILDGCSFTQNRSNGGSSYGGGAIGASGSYLYANNTIFANNSTQEIGGAINIYGGNVYLMNCTVAGNTTTKSSSCGGGIGKNGGVFHAVNSVFIDNYAKISGDKVRSDIGIYGGSGGTLNNCVYSKIQGSMSSTINCKVDESNTTASTYTDNGIILSDGSTSASFSHPVLTTGTNSYSKYVIINASGNAAIGGTSTYFDYSDINNIKMGYGDDSNIIALGGLGTPTSDKKVTTYYEGGSRANGVIGASGADEGITHTVTFNLNGGTMTGTNPVTVDDGAKVTRPANDPTKDGYVFAGWYANAGFNNEFDFDNTIINSDTIIYAKWDKLITSASATITAPVGGEHPLFTATSGNPDAYSAIIDTWYDLNNNGAHLTNSDTFVAGNEYQARIHFTANDGYQFADSVTYTINGTPNYATFDTAQQRGMNFTATAPATSQVTFNLNGGTMTGTNPVTVDDGAKVTRPTTDPIKDGYVFAGWYADAGLTQEFDFDNTTITADTTIYAKWNQVTTTTYTVTFDLNGGTRKEGLEAVTTDVNVTDGEEMSLYSYVQLAVNAPEGKVFDAIEINGTRYELDNSTYTIHSNVNIKFLWKDPYKITLNINGGTPNDASMELEEVIPSIITLTNPLVLTLNDTNLGKVNPPTGKAFSHYEIDGTEYAIGDEYIIYNNKNVTIKWIWEDIHEETLTITGDNQTFTLGNTNDITITCSGALDELTAIKVNGVVLEEANRELASGSTVLTLKNSYLNTLSVGTYTVTFEYGANTKAATLNVVEATNNDDNNNNNNNNTNTNDNTNNNTNNNTSNNPQTSYNVVDYVYTLIIGIICLAGGTVYLKRKKLFGNR